MSNQSTQQIKQYLNQELIAYEESESMTLPERKELRKWVKAQNSVHSNPGLWAYENGNEMDFLDALRMEDGLCETRQNGAISAET
jgi:hypothetical protein